jgi:type III restriction enzyme
VEETRLTRSTVVRILTGVRPETFGLFRRNPEEFIVRSARIVNEQKAATVIERIAYDLTEKTFGVDVFTKNSLSGAAGVSAFPLDKHIYDYLVTDSKTERAFAQELDASKEVSVFAKLPRGFFIPTPVGNYNPDWAIAFREDGKKYVYFVAETKGSMESLELRLTEKAKVHCARKHFERLSSTDLKYDVVDSYEELLNMVML